MGFSAPNIITKFTKEFNSLCTQNYATLKLSYIKIVEKNIISLYTYVLNIEELKQ